MIVCGSSGDALLGVEIGGGGVTVCSFMMKLTMDESWGIRGLIYNRLG